MELHRVRRRRATAIALAAMIAAGLTVAPTLPDAGATQDVKSERLAGANRFATAAAVAKAGFPTGSATVVVASGRSFPDALAGAALGLPVLLTERDSLPAPTATAIDDLKATKAIILGGTAAVSDDVADDIADHADVTRIAGNDRYETAALIAQSIGAANVGDIGGKATAIVATGAAFADALAGGPLATGGTSAGVQPILLVSDEVPDSTAKALDDLNIEQVIILGGTAAVSPAVESELEDSTGSPAVRLAGTNRYGTAAVVGDYAIDTLKFAAKEALLASGLDFADALAGGPLGGVRTAPLLLTDPAQLPQPTEAFLADHADTVATVTTLGGTAAVSTSTAQAAEKAAETPAKGRVNETIAVSPTAAASLASGATRDFTVTGLGTTAVDIALLPCSYVKTQTDGKTAFANSNANVIADGAADGGSAPDTADVPGFISKVNGEDRQEQDPTITDDYVDDAAPTSGAVSFTVTGPGGTSTACVIPVVFNDANNGDSLTVPTTNPALPVEDFGTGGATTFTPNGAGVGPFNVDVKDNNETANYFVGCAVTNAGSGEIVDSSHCSTYNYDDNDTFQLNQANISLAQFEAILSPGDDVGGSYSPTPTGKSTFNIFSDEAPEPPTPGPTAPTDDTATSITIRFFESSRTTVTEYRLYRVVKPSGGCPAFSNATHVLIGDPNNPVKDENQSAQPGSPIEIEDTSVTAGATYCYRLVSVDQGDEGPPTAALEHTAGTASTTTIAPPADAKPTFSVVGHSADNVLNNGDTHVFTFSEAMTVSGSATYTVTSAGDPEPITVRCGISASCALSADGKTLTATIGVVLASATFTYPLTITAMTGITDSDGTADAPVLADNDTTIENAGPPA
jgi:putative cell wall-binding protein